MTAAAPRPPMSASNFHSQREVYDGIAWRVMSAIEDPDAARTSWKALRGDVQREFAQQIGQMYSRNMCDREDGADLIDHVVTLHDGGLLDRIAETAVGRMEAAVEAAVERAPHGALLSALSRDLRADNALAVDLLSEYGDRRRDVGSDLIDTALRNMEDRVQNVSELLGTREVVFLVKREQPSEGGPGESADEANDASGPPSRLLGRLDALRVGVGAIAAIVGLLAAVLGLLGLTLLDFAPAPCDLWPFSLTPRCG